MSGLIGLLASAAVLAPSTASAERPVDSAAAGTIEVWGTTDASSGFFTRTTHAPDRGPWAAVTLGSNAASFGITADGTLKRLTGTEPLLDVPADLTSALAVDSYGNKAAAVKSDGSVQIWGETRGYAPQTLTPRILGAKATDVALSANTMIVLLEGGRVGSLFAPNAPYAITQFDGVDLDGAVQIEAGVGQGYARLAGGGVVGWTAHHPIVDYPAEVRGDDLADPVTDFAVNDFGMAAVTESGDVHTWDSSTGEPFTDAPRAYPADAATGTAEDVAATKDYFAVRTATDNMIVWGQLAGTLDHPLITTTPEEVDGQRIAHIVGGDYTFAAIVSPPPAAPLPSTTTISAGAGRYGSAGRVTVTVVDTTGHPTAGTVTLSGAGTTQAAALADGTATFALDKALVAGTYKLTAAYTGSRDLNASVGTAGYVVKKAKSKPPALKVNRAATSTKKGRAAVTVGSNAGLATATGTATVTLKKGRTAKKINVTLSGGRKSISLPKLKKGTWTVRVSYNGDKNYVAQKSKSYKLKIKQQPGVRDSYRRYP